MNLLFLGEFYAIETFGTTGRGWVVEDGECSHYMKVSFIKVTILQIHRAHDWPMRHIVYSLHNFLWSAHHIDNTFTVFTRTLRYHFSWFISQNYSYSVSISLLWVYFDFLFFHAHIFYFHFSLFSLLLLFFLGFSCTTRASSLAQSQKAIVAYKQNIRHFSFLPQMAGEGWRRVGHN